MAMLVSTKSLLVSIITGFMDIVSMEMKYTKTFCDFRQTFTKSDNL